MDTVVAGRAGGRVAVIEREVDIRRPPEAVFDYVSDPLREPEWNPRLRRVTRLGDALHGVGARYELEFLPGDPMVVECLRYDRPVGWATAGASRRLAAGFAGWVRPTPEGARLALRMELRPRGLLALALPLLRRHMERDLPRHLTAIKARLEG